MNTKINNILTQICQKGSIYDQVIDNIITPNFHQKDELISELAIQFHSQEKNIIKAIDGGYFKYLFIRIIKNQVHSSTSPFHKNCRVQSNNAFDISESFIELEDDDFELNDKMLKEEQRNALEQAIKSIKTTWFEMEMFNLYYKQNKTYRQIEEEYNIDHVLVFLTVKAVKERIKKQIKKIDIY
jgi:DNA-directed RNA polymerase specialized sigma subunit